LFKDVRRSRSPSFQLPAKKGGATIRTKDAGGHVILSYPVILRQDTDRAPNTDETALIQTSLPYSDRIATLELLLHDEIKDTFEAGGDQAAVSALSLQHAADMNPSDLALFTAAGEPEAASRGILVRWQAGNERVRYTVQASADSGHTWNTLATKLVEHYFVIDPRRLGLSDGTMLSIRIIANDGFSSSALATKEIRVGER
jgi:hypothetical protein